MSALSIDAPHRPLWPVFLALLLLAVAVASSAHALSKHSEASAVARGCNRGPHSTWQATGAGHAGSYWLICQTDAGDYGVHKIRCTKRGWQSVTAFVPNSSQWARGSLQRAIEYVSARSVQTGGLETACP